MKRVIFLNRFFYPDHSATSQIVSGLAFHLAASGMNVHAITSGQLYDSPRASLPKEEVVNGVHIYRMPTTRFGRSGLLGRAVDYASYYGLMWHRARSLAGPGDILVAKTDPPLTSIVAMRVALRSKARLVNWLQDIYPEIAGELGVPLMRGMFGHALCQLRDHSLQRAAVNVVVGERMAERLQLLGVASDRVHVIPNWSDDESLCPVRPEENPLRREWALEQKFVVGYSGNLGRAHEIDTVLSAAALLREHPSIVFLFIGGGHQFDRLDRLASERNFGQMFRFIAYQPQELLKFSLSVPDVHLISLRPELEGLIVPSKFYGIAAVGKPLISITARDGEIARLVRQHECGLVVDPGNGPALAEALISLCKDPVRVTEMGKRARSMLDGHFTRRHAFARWEKLLAAVN
jgi:colanic acid biosynthesis glycosyl transferase WcaI